MDMKKLLEARKIAKTAKPKFVRQNHGKKKKAESSYRKPRGTSSRMRINKAGYPANITQGYRSPSAVKDTNAEGLKYTLVSNVADIEKADPKTDVVVISGLVGVKKSMDLFKKATEMKFKIDNFDDQRVKDLQKEFDDRKAANKKKREDKVKKEKEAAKEKETKKEKKDTNEEKKEEKKEKRKVSNKEGDSYVR